MIAILTSVRLPVNAAPVYGEEESHALCAKRAVVPVRPPCRVDLRIPMASGGVIIRVATLEISEFAYDHWRVHGKWHRLLREGEKCPAFDLLEE